MLFDELKRTGINIWVHKNFISEKEAAEYSKIASELKEDLWTDGPISSSIPVPELADLRNKIGSLLEGDLQLGESESFVRMIKGSVWGDHTDDHNHLDLIKKAKEYQEGSPYDLVEIPQFGLVVYFNDFEGGELFYPTQNIEYKPEPGDLVIHSANASCLHGVKELLSDVRYSYSNHIYREVKVAKDGL